MEYRPSVAGNSWQLLHFLVDNSSKLPTLQDDRHEFLLQTEDT